MPSLVIDAHDTERRAHLRHFEKVSHAKKVPPRSVVTQLQPLMWSLMVHGRDENERRSRSSSPYGAWDETRTTVVPKICSPYGGKMRTRMRPRFGSHLNHKNHFLVWYTSHKTFGTSPRLISKNLVP